MSERYKETLFHGTVARIDHVDVTKGRGNKDFGKGFYMAVSRRQAVGMMYKKYREAVRRSRNKKDSAFTQRLYQITIDTVYMHKLKVKTFETADEDWIDFVLLCREKGGVPHDYDVVIGPKADDDTMLCLKVYWDGLYGRVGSALAKQVLLSNLEPENLGIQYYVGRQEVADRLIKDIREIDWR